MTDESSELELELNDLSLMLVMVDPENLISLGELLEKVEGLIEVFQEAGYSEGATVLVCIRSALEAVILEKTPDKNEVMEAIGQGVSLLQDMQRDLAGGGEFAGDSTAFFNEIQRTAGVAPPGEAAAPQPDAVPDLPPASPVVEPAPEPLETAPAQSEGIDAEYEVSRDEELFFGFINESLEHIESIEVHIISLEQDPEDKETLNAVFRPFHTIKGVSGFLNLKHVHKLTHTVENVLDDARNDRLPVTAPLIDLVLDAVDILKRMITDVQISLEAGAPLVEEYDIHDFNQRLALIQQGEGEKPPAREDDEGSPYSGLKVGEILVEQGLLEASDLQRIIETQEGKRLAKLGDLAVEKGIISPEDLEEALALQKEDRAKRIGEILIETGKAVPSQISQAIREQENQRSQKLGEILIREKQAGAREVAGALREQKKAAEGAAMAHMVKVDTTKLDGLVDLVGELVIAQSLVASNERVLGLKDQKLYRDLSHMARITSDLQRTAMSMRMVQIKQTFQKMIRLVRDLSRKSGKLVDLTMSGEETEIDRNMVEAIYDPLVHMVRNSVDHGIEPSEIRKERNKSPEGRIHLRAFHQGGNVVIEIEDDGKGLDRDRILAKAVERGLAGPEDNLSETAVYNLVFQPGFSTAEKVTDVSGRGVGMDVVKKAIEKLRGKVEISSQPGLGSTISIRLPLTLAIIDGMIVKVGDNRYILPTVAIRESFRPGPEDYHTVKNQGEMIKVRQSLLPLIRLDRVLGTTAHAQNPMDGLVVVVENEGERRCCLVDEVIGKQEVVIKTLGERLKYVRSLAGGSILGDGRVGLILDIAGVFEVSDGIFGGMVPGPEAVAAADSDWEMDEDWGMGPT